RRRASVGLDGQLAGIRIEGVIVVVDGTVARAVHRQGKPAVPLVVLGKGAALGRRAKHFAIGGRLRVLLRQPAALVVVLVGAGLLRHGGHMPAAVLVSVARTIHIAGLPLHGCRMAAAIVMDVIAALPCGVGHAVEGKHGQQQEEAKPQRQQPVCLS
ncbi:LigA, partial [Dorea sp. D27]